MSYFEVKPTAMKSLFIVFLGASIFCSSAHSQTNTIDSLKNYINNETDVDKKIIALSELTNEYQNPNDKLIYAKKAYQLSKDSSNKGKAIASLEVGICYGMLGKLDSSKYYFRKLLTASIKANDSVYISRAYNGLGNLNRMQSNLDESLRDFLTSLTYAAAVPQKDWTADILTNISGVYFDLQDFEESLKKVREAREIYEEMDDQPNLSYTANLLAIVHRALGNLDKAYSFNQEALKMLLTSKDTIQIIYNYISTTEILIEQGKLNEAINYGLRVSSLAEDFGEIDPLISSKTTLGFIYLRKGDTRQAEKFINEAISICNSYEFKSKLPDLYELKGLIAASKRDFAGALNFVKKRKLSNDSIRSMEIADRISELNVKYETEKKENEIIRLNTQQKVKTLQLSQARTRNVFLLITIALGAIIIGVIWKSYGVRIKINRELKAANNTKDRLFSIVAHDIKNPLSAFKAIANSLEENYRSMSNDEVGLFISKLDNTATKLSDLLQNLLDWSITQSGSLNFKEEKVKLHSIVEETTILFQGAIEAKDLHIENKISASTEVKADYKMLFSVVRNLFSNAVKFTPKKGKIIIDSKYVDQLVEVIISDTGSGLNDELKETIFEKKYTNESKTGTGLGLVLCREFVERNGGSIRVKSEKGIGSQFIFTLKSVK